jgi:hypothetical protein
MDPWLVNIRVSPLAVVVIAISTRSASLSKALVAIMAISLAVAGQRAVENPVSTAINPFPGNQRP